MRQFYNNRDKKITRHQDNDVSYMNSNLTKKADDGGGRQLNEM
jgi:hypothetical protein